MTTKKPENQVYEAVEQLWEFSHLTPENYTVIKEYKEELESKKESLEFMLKYGNGKHPERLSEKINELQSELQWFEDNVKIYRNTRVSVFDMNQIVSHLFWNCEEKYFNGFFDFKDLVEMINCFFDIKEPYKPANKIAYGWNFALKKGYKAFRPYLYGCIRNYLNRNGKTFETKTLQTICNLRDLTDEDM